MKAILIEGPAVEPVALAEMKAFLRLDDAAEDDLIATLIGTARQAVEASCGRMLISQTWRLYRDGWPDDRVVRVPVSPLISVEGIRVYGAQGIAQVVAPMHYCVDGASDPAEIVVDAAAPEPGRGQNIEVDLRAGFGPDPDAVQGRSATRSACSPRDGSNIGAMPTRCFCLTCPS